MSDELISRDDIVGLIGERVLDDAWAERSVAAIERAAAEKAWWEACLRIADGESNLDIADTYQKQNPYLEVIPNE